MWEPLSQTGYAPIVALSAHGQDPRSALIAVVNSFFKGSPAYYLTMTFRKPDTRATIAVDALRCWLSVWRTQGRRCPLSRILFSVEAQSRGTAHLHALSDSGPPPTYSHCAKCFASMGWNSSWPTWQILKESWYQHHGIARIYPFDETRAGGCAGYVTKYILSDECCDWGLWEEGKDF